MDARRLRFLAALFLFIAWVAGLGVLAIKSGHRPINRMSVPVVPPQK